MNETTIMEIWDMFKEYMPEKNRESAANQYVDFLIGKYDTDNDTLVSLIGYDAHLDDAIKFVTQDLDYLDEDKDEYGLDDDEDY
jgi:hypothetical protein